MNDTDASMSTSVTPASRRQIDRLPYLPGLDGLRAVAVVAVMIYHANHKWLSGGFLGVEVFFVISGYLITLLLIGEYARDGHIRLAQFWKRRFRRLLPPLFVVLAGLAVYMAAFRRTPMGRTRGDFAGGLFYVSNWYQIIVGQGYTANEAFVPLRHLWSLAVEEQFYLIWPLVMVAVLIRRSRPRPAAHGVVVRRDKRRNSSGRGVALSQRRRCRDMHGHSTTGVLDVARPVRQHQRGAVSGHHQSCRWAVCSARRLRWCGDRWRSCVDRCATRRTRSTSLGCSGWCCSVG